MIENTSQLIEHIAGAKGILGAILVGSSTENYKDNLSDLDVEVITTHELTRPPECLVQSVKISRRLDLSYVDMDSFLLKRTSPKDVDHWPYQSCRILYDPAAVLRTEILAITAIDPAIRSKRIWLHFFEFIYYSRRFNKLEYRISVLNRSLAAAKAVESLIKTIFLVSHRWPPLLHWSEQQLQALDISSALKECITEMLKVPNRSMAQELEASFRSELFRLAGNIVPDDETLIRDVTSSSFQMVRERYSSF